MFLKTYKLNESASHLSQIIINILSVLNNSLFIVCFCKYKCVLVFHCVLVFLQTHCSELLIIDFCFSLGSDTCFLRCLTDITKTRPCNEERFFRCKN